MKLLSPTQHKRLNEAAGFLLLSAGLVTLLSLVSYHAQDPSWDTASGARPLNLIGYPGAYLADVFLQTFGVAAMLFPLLAFLLSWKWIRSEALQAGGVKVFGSVLLTLSICTTCSFAPFHIFAGTVPIGGALGLAAARYLVQSLNVAGALLATGTALVLSLYLVSTFTIEKVTDRIAAVFTRFSNWRAAWVARRAAASKARKVKAKAKKTPTMVVATTTPAASTTGTLDTPPWQEPTKSGSRTIAGPAPAPEVEPYAEREPAPATEYATIEEIPICPLEDTEPEPVRGAVFHTPPPRAPEPPPVHTQYSLPPTALLNEPAARNAYDEQELKDTAARIKAKFEEFNVFGNVTQINPGPVVTTFEFKPDSGVKYSRITNLTEDLCLGLQAESILIERIPGKPTVGIEVPNTRRELIVLRQMLESDEFTQSTSHLAIPLGKDINGRIRVTGLESMPHLLIAGSTGSGKSVMINSMIMSILYKATPDDVRVIMVDPKRVELGMYEGIPHLLTPVIVDPKKATNALRNAVLEMERRLRLLAEYGVRNIDQFNKKIRQMQDQPRHLFPEDTLQEDPKPLPYILILIDELADLMMLEGRNVEESVTRLAQMARAVGMHLVLATQRPSVDVITGIIKANFPSRISFRVATRVDSRTVLDVMGAEHLLGKGDMLFLPPGSSRLTRVHGAFVTESEINRVVDFWKAQAAPEYDQSFLVAPPNEEESAADAEASSEGQDPMYEEAVRLVLQMGKASTSTLQRHLRLGYGRAARILDMMQRDGIIGAPDGSKPREVLKRPDWLREVEDQIR
jgi:DNA segregation ATPase FtsK/SpoIIIE, S-DNA-T family